MTSEFLMACRPPHLTGEAAWAAYEALGGDGLTGNADGWVRRSCPAHDSRSGNSLVFKIDTSDGTDRLVVFDHAGCTPRQVLEAAGVDVSAYRHLDGVPVGEWLRRGARRPAAFPAFEDPVVGPGGPDLLDYFAGKRRFDVEVLRRAGVTAVQYPWRYRRERHLQVRARFPFTVDGRLVGAWDRAIFDVGPGGRRWTMAGTIPVPFGWDGLRRARDSGHVYIVEGPTDAMALRHAFPEAVVLGAGVGRSMWRPWWGPEFAWLTVWLATDNDRGGRMTCDAAHAVLDRHAFEVHDVLVPKRYGDLDDWRRGAGDRFREEFVDALQRAAWPALKVS